MQDYFDYAFRRESSRVAQTNGPVSSAVVSREAEEIAVQEHHASTTIVERVRERMYDLLRKR